MIRSPRAGEFVVFGCGAPVSLQVRAPLGNILVRGISQFPRRIYNPAKYRGALFA